MLSWKISFPHHGAFLKTVMLCWNVCFEKVALFCILFILSSSSEKKKLFRKVTALKNFLKKCLLFRSFTLKKKLFRKMTCYEKVTVLKKEKKAAALKKYLLRKSNCCFKVVTLKKCKKVTSPKIKLSWKSRNTCENWNCYLKKSLKLD